MVRILVIYNKMQSEDFIDIEYMEFGDTRNPKANIEMKYNKHNRGKKERLRIAEIKQQREEQSAHDKGKLIKKYQDSNNQKQQNKRILKTTPINDKNYENNIEHVIKNIKKKKKPKKDKVFF